jgi:1-acyl-sn-glycerol-3-phosphate acyltransferase
LSIKGKENIPDSGPFIAACNHVSFADPPIIGSVFRREIAYLAKAELFQNSFFKNILERVNAFPVHREKMDVSAIKTCIRILKKNKMPLLLFPEGTRIKGGKLGRPLRGIAFIAAQTKLPILPLYIENSENLRDCFIFEKRLKVRIGKLLLYSEYQHLAADKKHYAELAELVMTRIQELKEDLS